jgi:SAM-dependent methyltransferase
MSADGYVTDVGYTAGFYREMAPSHLAFAAVLAGFSPRRALRPRRVLELGFGQGFGLALLAAANPDTAFEGYDFNPEHVRYAKGIAKRAGLSNLELLCASFETAAARAGKQDVDIIVMHGVMAWVAPATQDAIVEIVRRRLRPGGLLYVSYNAMPGWAPLAPIRRFILEVKRHHPGGSEQQLMLALDLLAKLRRGNARYFAANPGAAPHFDQMLTMDRRYLAHEYLDEHWEPLHFSDLAARLGAADLSFIATSTLSESLDACTVPQAVLPLLKTVQNPVFAETLRDYATNKMFRRDIFARGAVALAPAERRTMLAGFGFVLIVPREQVSFRFFTPGNELIGNDELYRPIADHLARETATFDELLALPAFGEDRIVMLIECLTLLVHSGQVLPIVAPAASDPSPALRFNRMIIDEARAGVIRDNLASPVTRTGVAVNDFTLLALAAWLDGKGKDANTAARHGLDILKRLGRRPHKDQVPVEDDEEAISFLAGHIEPILRQTIPTMHRLGVV